jgi:Tol biopolymer transport system component
VSAPAAAGRSPLLWTAAVLLAAGCGGDSSGLDGTAIIRAAASTTGDARDPDGYTVTLDGATTRTLAPDGLTTFDNVEPGQRTLTLGGVAPNCAVEGPNPRTLTVTEGAVADAAFSVRCSARNGALRISAATSGAPLDPDGYTVAVDDGASVALGTTGTVTIDPVPEGAHQVRLGGVEPNCVVAGSNPRPVTIVASATTSVSFSLTCTSQVGTLVVTTATSGSPADPDGYTLALDGGSSQAVGTNATLTLNDVAAGSHAVQLGGLAGNCTVSGSNPVTVSVVAGGSVSVAFAVACSPTTGSIRVTTQTSGSPVDPDGYTVSVDGGSGQAIGVAGSVTLVNLSSGNHSVQLAGLASNCTTSSNPRTVAVSAGATVETMFGVTCTPTTGTIQVTTATGGSPADPDGYSVRLDTGSPQAIGVSASVSYPNVSVGTHAVALAGLAGNCGVNGSNPRSVSVTGGATAQVTLDVECAAALRSQILFLSTRGGSTSDIYYMNEDGSNVRRLTSHAAEDQDVAISPDGTRIVFASDRTGTFRVYVMNSDGSGVTNVSGSGPGQDTDPEWSPDGSRIVFESSRGGSEEIYVMNADGSGVVQLTNDGGENGDVDWSPDGTKIVFETHRDGPNGEGEIYVMNADGSNLVNLTQSPTVVDADPAWSPDGGFIAWESNRGNTDKANFDVWIMNADGSNPRRLTSNAARDGSPTWSPDGSRIAFDSDRSGNFDVWTVDLNGADARRLTSNSAFDGFPEWTRPAPAFATGAAVTTMIARVSGAAAASEPAAAPERCRTGAAGSTCRRSAELPDWRAKQQAPR